MTRRFVSPSRTATALETPSPRPAAAHRRVGTFATARAAVAALALGAFALPAALAQVQAKAQAQGHAASAAAPHVAASAASVPAVRGGVMPGVSVLTGGIGKDEADAMRAQASQWPLRIQFAGGEDGGFIARSPLKITGAAGTVVDLAEAGPITFVKLPPGAYTVAASWRGQPMTRNVKVGPRGADVLLRWGGPAASAPR